MAEHKGPLNGNGIPSVLVNLVLAAFVMGWLVSLGAEVVRSTYSAPTGLNETMIALVTAFFVAQQRLGKEDKKDDGDSDQTRQQEQQFQSDGDDVPEEDAPPTDIDFDSGSE